MKVTVLAGGISTEREISIVSGTQVCKALRSLGHRAILADVFCGDEREGSIGEDTFPERYDVEEAASYMRSFDNRLEEMKSRRSFFGPNILKICMASDTVFMALHGSNGEDGKIQATFELLGIHYTGSSYLGSALAMDKDLSKQLFRENGVPTPEGIVLRREIGAKEPSVSRIGFPCIVKPACGGSSVGVNIAWTGEEYQRAVEIGFSYESVLIAEKYIKGREFSCGIVDGQAYPVIEIAPLSGFYDYVNKYKSGAAIETCPADLPNEISRKIQEVSLNAYHALHLTCYGRIDLMMDEDNNIYCLEANTLPGMTPTSLLPQEAAAMGISFPELCEKLIQVSIRQ